MAVFDDALARLDTDQRALVEDRLREWTANETWSALASNLRTECALACDDLEACLRGLAARQTARSPDDRALENNWKADLRGACEALALHGKELAGEARPHLLGRAWSVLGLVSAIDDANEDYDEDTANHDVREYLNAASPPSRFRRALASANLGRPPLMWATYKREDSSSAPFDGLPPTAAALRCALGLGWHAAGEPLVALVYHTAAPEHPHPIHRPTIADANTYTYYRPHPHPDDPCGYTQPVPPNPDGLPAMPEVVHKPVTGAALRRHSLLK